MLDQDKSRRILRAQRLWPYTWVDGGGMGCLGILVVYTVGNHFAIGDATYSSLLKQRAGFAIKVHAAMPQAIGTHRIEAIFGLGQGIEIYLWVVDFFTGLAGGIEWIRPINRFAVCHVGNS
ncbi:MAG: hypothetical protein CVV09_17550 [Gammaproteobacteria bacterium HGW-Gammaproteobacteria-13]|nr:MAG: hypothetical protein CVV09_17550 [Gammaproteobacteria bacterium HGW-Gammaproteobacteria-13]